jgi:nicotinamidase-related amidase
MLIMSLQRVLEIARKNGMPVIITDDSGRDPMVILPLEQFEAMTFSTQSIAQSTQYPVHSSQSMKESPLVARNSELDDAIAEMTAERLKNRVEETAIQLESLADQGSDSPEISLEERFYLEPDEAV